MKTDLAKKIIAEWLEERVLPPLVQRDTQGINLESLTEILAIVGPRRAGKTYFMCQLIQELLDRTICNRNDILFVDFEDYRLINFAAEDIEALFVAFNQFTGKYPAFLFFDEIQRLPDWSRVLRTLHNQNRYRIIVSGSNAELLGHEISTELRGRYRDFLMMPFSFREYLRFKNISYSESVFYTPSRGVIIKAFDDYLREGGFPEVAKQATPIEKRQILKNYYQTIFYRDILEWYNIKAKYVLDAVMAYCLNIYGDLFSVSRFEKHLKGHDLPGSKRTIANYLCYLEDAFFIIIHDKFSYSPRKRIMNPKKIYLLDTGFTFLSTDFSENKGKLMENVVAVELFRRQNESFYYKDRQECDFIVKRNAKPEMAIQVCWQLNARNEKRELQGLVAAMNALDIPEGIILTYDEEKTMEYYGRKIKILPVWKWLLTFKII